MPLRRSIPALALLVLSGCQASTTISPLWGTLEAGPFDTGLRVVTFVDTTRVDGHSGGRPVEVSLWYPAAPTKEIPRLLFRDYVGLALQPEDAPGPDAFREWLALGISGDAHGIGRDTLDLILHAPMQARRGAVPAQGSFPLALWTMRHETPVAQSVLCEYLASHGYVVASARYAGAPLPLPWTMNDPEERLSTFALHLQDLNFALDRLAHEPHVDASRTAILTWSYAYELGPRVQMQHANIGLVIGLSSNPLGESGVYQGEKAASFLVPERLNATYVVMTERVGPNGEERSAPAMLEQLPSASYFMRFTDLAHGNFNTVEGMLPGVFGITQVQPWSKGGAVAQLGYETIARYVFSFLHRYTQSTAPFELSWEAELPPDFVTITRYGS